MVQPLFINLSGKKVVIAGGGKVAARKARSIGAEQVELTFIAPSFYEEVVKLSEEYGYTLIHREAKLEDFNNAFLVILATNNRKQNKTWAKQLSPHRLVCVVDEAGEGNVIFPAAVQRGQLQIAITTNGASPKLARSLKHDLESWFDVSWEPYLEFLSQCRQKIKNLNIPFEEKNKLLEAILDDGYRINKQAQREFLARLENGSY